MQVTAPGSTANLGPGFDCLAIAVDLPFHLAVDEADAELPACDQTHPAVVAYRAAGGTSEDLRWRSPIPPARGLGFSGAARVAGAYAACREAGDVDAVARQRAFEVAAELEGHADNAAASAFGGFVVTAASDHVRLPVGGDVRVVTWSPRDETSTERARAALSDRVELIDAVFNVGRASLLVAAVSTGRWDLLRTATEDRLHTETRLALAPASREAFAALTDDPEALGVWLSGSGPTVAALVRAEKASDVAAGLPASGTTRVLGVAHEGVVAHRG